MKMISALVILCLFTACDPIPAKNLTGINDSVQYWDLKTGSHIAYIHIAAKVPSNSTTLIFLHGGPGACQVNSFGKEAPAEWYRKLAEHNFDIYLYDQAGSGYSGRLPDPAVYTVERHVQDLECIRMNAGNRPCILIGDSWGATLACHYMASFPGKVSKAIFTSPGPIDFRDWNDAYSNTPVFPNGWYGWIKKQYGESGLNRYHKLDSLMQNDIHKAYQFAGDDEMDNLADAFITSEILSTCVYNKEFAKSAEFSMEGMGWWCSTMTVWDLINENPIKNLLRTFSNPVMIMRGNADYLESGIAEEYHDVFSDSRLIKVPRAGHFIWLDRPSVYQKNIERFLFHNH